MHTLSQAGTLWQQLMIALNPDHGGKKELLCHEIPSPGRLESIGSTGIPLAFPNTERFVCLVGWLVSLLGVVSFV